MKKSTRNWLLAGVAAVAFVRYEAYTHTADPTEAQVNAKNYRAYMEHLKNLGWQGPESEYHDSLPDRTNAHFADVASKLQIAPNDYVSLVVVHAFDGHPTHVWLRSKKPDGDLYAPVPTVNMLNDVVAAVPPGFIIDGLDDPRSVAPPVQSQAQAAPASTPDGGEWTSPAIVMQLIQTAAMVGIAVWFIMSMRGGGQAGAMKLLKSRHKSFDKLPPVKFKDVAGVDEAKDDLMDVVRFLKDPTEFTRLGGRMPKGILVIGPPGTGKTLLCRAVAGEADIPAFYINASEFVEMFVGVGASRIRNMFEEIRKAGRALLVIDELDALGKHRGTGVGGGNDEREQALNQLLTEIDGFETHQLIVFGLTNRQMCSTRHYSTRPLRRQESDSQEGLISREGSRSSIYTLRWSSSKMVSTWRR